MEDFKKYKIVSVCPSHTNELTLIGTVMGSQRYYIHQIYLANVTKVPAVYRMWITSGGVSLHNVINFNTPLPGSTSIVMNMGIYLNVGEELVVQTAVVDTICFSVFGALSNSEGEFEGEYE